MFKKLAGMAAVAVVLAGVLLYSQWRPEPLKVSGLIEADEIRVGSRVGGRVKRVPAVEGKRVQQGEVLVELEPYDLLEQRAEAQKQLDAKRAEYERLKAGFRAEEIAQAQARHEQLAARLKKLEVGPRPQELAAARANLKFAQEQHDLAKSQLARLQAARSASTVEELDRAATELKTAQARVDVRQADLDLLVAGTRTEEIAEARAQLEEANQAWQLRVKGYRPEEIAQAQAAMEAAQAVLNAVDRHVEELTIKAPVDAVVEAVELQPGDLVSPNAPVISLMDTRQLWVRAYVPENHLDLQVGHNVQISVDSFPGQKFAAHVSFIARQAEFMPGNVQTPEERSKQVFRIKVQLDAGLDKLRPGMAADVWLEPAGGQP